MAPIRTAFIGLSSTAKTSWAVEGHLPYLLSSRGRSHYEIVALLDSIVTAAEAARAEFDLPQIVKVFDDPRELVADPHINFVVCNTRVDAGKAVYEIPNSIIGLQSRVFSIVLKLKEVLDSGRIGHVLSSDIQALGTWLPTDSLPEGVVYFAERNIGGNPINIAYSHMINYVHDVLDEFDSFEGRMQIQRPVLKITDKDEKMKHTVKSDIWTAFQEHACFLWTINGENGEIVITSPAGSYLHSDSYGEPIAGWQKELLVLGRRVAAIYERFAAW
ncbi:uncharacterized protein BCR38DRAFT_454012 [Pseudomassariella vexata]|uniref:Gal80p-like C-terminal domain-containing protein n=1 Tax=Pseudomassariella vexata TaxID=1141098 RepID=A0A1Y2EJL6_9PEZI|nr:uncharacterized protein BCR38DRAFT_454012 [Pseudomassariella vexata]ORY71494.1 hypothetical protein BCR38DRAFT_454012 [Pseudomassariella vexata]